MKNKKGFTLVEIIVVLVVLAILAAIAFPSLLGYIEKSKEAKDLMVAKNVLESAQIMGKKYYEVDGYYNTPASESISNVVKAPNRTDEHAARINEVYKRVTIGNKDLEPFKAIFKIEKGNVVAIRYKNLKTKKVMEWKQGKQAWETILTNDDPKSDDWAKDSSVCAYADHSNNDIWWNGYDPANGIPYLSEIYNTK